MTKTLGCIILMATLFCTQGLSQAEDKHSGKEENNMLATNECFAKGGIGIVNANLYIDLKSTKNELLLGVGNRWVGQDASTQEVEIVFEGKVWSTQVLPTGFDLSKAVVISFEVEKIRFFDFSEMSGGYYKRPKIS